MKLRIFIITFILVFISSFSFAGAPPPFIMGYGNGGTVSLAAITGVDITLNPLRNDCTNGTVPYFTGGVWTCAATLNMQFGDAAAQGIGSTAGHLGLLWFKLATSTTGKTYSFVFPHTDDRTVTWQDTDGTVAFTSQTFYIGTTQVAINRASNALTLAGLTFTSPVIGDATGTSLATTGIIDGKVNVTVTTNATTIDSAVQKQGYFINNGDSAAKGIYTLPTAALGLQYCIALYSEHATGATAVMKFQTSAAAQYIALDGVRTASGGLIKSTGAAGDSACVVGISTTEWVAFHSSGTWSKD